jgi:uncharacterized protein YjiS (DUF1127 family)
MATGTEIIMDIGYIRPDPDPELRQQFRRASRERAAAFSAFFRAIGHVLGAGLHATLAALRRRRRRRRTFDELSQLSDRELKDIGLFRSQIHHVAEAAAAAPELRLTLADLQRQETRRFIPPVGERPATATSLPRRALSGRPEPRPSAQPGEPRQRKWRALAQ